MSKNSDLDSFCEGLKVDKYLVFDIGGTFTKYAIMDTDCNFYEKNKFPTVLSNMDEFVQSLKEVYEQHPNVVGIALSAPGMIDSDNGMMYNGGSLLFVQNINMAEILSRECGVPVTVENDAKSAGLAEVWKGSLADCNNAVAMIIGTAIGGAVIVDRKVLRGRHCMAGEFSYLIADVEDPLNFEKTVGPADGMPAIIGMVSEALGIPAKELSGEIIFERAGRGEQQVLDCLRRYAMRLAVQIHNYQYTLDPDRIAIGGGVSAQPLLFTLIREELDKLSKIFNFPLPVPEIVPCKFFNDSNLIGALYVHLQHRSKEK